LCKTLKMLKAVLFDMDGVIVDSEPLHRKAYYKMFADYGLEVTDSLYESFTGQATLPICIRLCDAFSLNVAPQELVTAKRRHFKKLFEEDNALELIDGVLDRIQEYHRNGLTLVLASSASLPNINRIFKRFDLDRYFVGKLSGADLAASKPHPEIFIKAAQTAGFSPLECMVIEDSTNGIKAAHAAGIFCVAYKSVHSHNQDYQLADYLIHDFKAIAFDRIPDFFPNV
jgi:beta-phosphoglucomutase